jgi:hypothetical protein
MSYIGNQVTSVPFITDVYSGAGGTSFGPLTIVPASPASVLIFVGGVYQRPTLDYTLNSNYVNFVSAPSSGTNNIIVHHIGFGFMATQVPADGTVTATKIGLQSVNPNNFSTSANTTSGPTEGWGKWPRLD